MFNDCLFTVALRSTVQQCVALFFIFQSELGYGKMSSYTKLDKLGEVSICSIFYSLLIIAIFDKMPGESSSQDENKVAKPLMTYVRYVYSEQRS